ncbi:MAG TPA: hypothetical protein VFC11_00335, partial [Methylocella sp.]|nr:hypothetical protein [Methylocella sp.]
VHVAAATAASPTGRSLKLWPEIMSQKPRNMAARAAATLPEWGWGTTSSRRALKALIQGASVPRRRIVEPMAQRHAGEICVLYVRVAGHL